MMKTKIGHGIFMWDGPERQTARYGYFYPTKSTYDDTATAEMFVDQKAAESFQGHRVKITAIVTESRPSSHLGDKFIGVFPQQTPAGEEVALGVGTFDFHAENPYCPQHCEIGLVPADGRNEYWIDPNNFFRLHDHTADIFVEPSDEPDHAAPHFELLHDPNKLVSNGDDSFQSRMRLDPAKKYRIQPKIGRLGDGLWTMSTGNDGDELKIEER